MSQQHQITKNDLRQTDWVDQPIADLADGEVRLEIDAFALTANNVTYAAFGDAPLFYWNFFPATTGQMGRVPVWGFANVVESKAEGVETGKRVYGYLPISKHLVVKPSRISDRGFLDSSEHRAPMSPIYSTYSFTDTDPAYVDGQEPAQMLFRPLYLTGWMICDSIQHGGEIPDAVMISSASSKTAIATAHGLQSRGISAVGITSERNKAFVEASGLYTSVVTYDEVNQIKADGKLAYVDFVGRPELTKQVHILAGDRMVRSMVIGITDWEGDRTPQSDMPGPVPEFFFVPDYAAARAKQMAPGELDRSMGADLTAFYEKSAEFVEPEMVTGTDAITEAWLNSVDGKISPTKGLICKF